MTVGNNGKDDASNRAPHLHASGRPNEEVFGWLKPGALGVFMYLDKNSLRVDEAYQRKKISNTRVLEIAKEFSWASFGVLSVAFRKEGAYYVFDGQHRTLASLRRSDIGDLPSLIFEFDKLSDEAKAFVQLNTNRGNVGALQKYKSRHQAEDADIMMVHAILTEFGIAVSGMSETEKHSDSKCVSAFEAVYHRCDPKSDPDHFERVIGVVHRVVGENVVIPGKLVRCISRLDLHLQKHHNQNIGDRSDLTAKLNAIGKDGLLDATRKMSNLMLQSGERIWTDGIIVALNAGKRANSANKVRRLIEDD